MEMNGNKKLDVLGIAQILPLDHTYVLETNESFRSVQQKLRAMPSPLSAWPSVDFKYVSYHRSGGGTIANILAFLGASGHDVGACGAVGDDDIGAFVKSDLVQYNIDIEHVATRRGHNTRTVFIVHKPGHHVSKQVHLKPSPLACYSPSQLTDLPDSDLLLVGRANESIVHCIDRFKHLSGTKLALHLRHFPWLKRRGQRALFEQLIFLSDIVIAWQPVIRQFCRELQIAFVLPENSFYEKSVG